MPTSLGTSRCTSRRTLRGTLALTVALAALLAACGNKDKPLPALVTGPTDTTSTGGTSVRPLTGTWVARNTGPTSWGDSLVLQLNIVDTVVTGTYRSVRNGVRETYSGRVTGAQVGTAVRLSLTYDPYEHGCPGTPRDCPVVVLRFTGTFTAQTTLAGTFADGTTTWGATFVPGGTTTTTSG